jgi:asparagine synthase (glutamine-hydrolysing)
MFNGIEVRMPFMDYRLVEFCFSLPLESKLGNGYTKRILRDAMKGIVPSEILSRKNKIGIAAPIQQWLSNYTREWAMEKTANERFAFVCEQLNASPKDLRQQLSVGDINAKNAQQIWLGLNFALLKL